MMSMDYRVFRLINDLAGHSAGRSLNCCGTYNDME